MRWILIVGVVTATASAQVVTSSSQLPDAVKNFGPGVAHGELPCAVEILQPRLNFASRFQAGYSVRIPLGGYAGGGHRWYVVFQVTPQEGNRQPVLFADSIDVPASPPYEVEEVHGAFLLGEGDYHVKWSILDDLGRVFREEWDLEAKPEEQETVAMPPGMAGDLSWHPANSPSAPAYPGRVTILVNAAPTAGYPWTMLVGTLAPLVERLSAASIRLVVVNLPREQELFHEDNFQLDGVNRVIHATNQLRDPTDLRIIILNHQPGVWDLLATLVNQAVQAPVHQDAVVFVGAPWWIRDPMPSGFPKSGKGLGPRFFSLHYPRGGTLGPMHGAAGGGGWQGPTGPIGMGASGAVRKPQIMDGALWSTPFDTIKQTVLRMRGKIFNLEKPADFDRAIEEIRRPAK